MSALLSNKSLLGHNNITTDMILYTEDNVKNTKYFRTKSIKTFVRCVTYCLSSGDHQWRKVYSFHCRNMFSV